MPADWSRQWTMLSPPSSPIFQPPSPTRIPRGPLSSLVHIALATLADNIEEASVEAIECLPYPLVCRLYDTLLLRTGWPPLVQPPLATWRTFSQVIFKHATNHATKVPLYLYAWRTNVLPSDVPELHQLTHPLRAPNFAFVTRLDLDRAWAYKVEELLTLADMENLAVLYILGEVSDETRREDGGSPSVSDRLVRGWSEKAKPFPNLRVLWITAPNHITADFVLRHASIFPCLTLCKLVPSDPAIGPTASGLGWSKVTPRPSDTSPSLAPNDKPMVLLSPAAALDQQPRAYGWPSEVLSTQSHRHRGREALNWLHGDWKDYLDQGSKVANTGLFAQRVNDEWTVSLPVIIERREWHHMEGSPDTRPHREQGNLLLAPKPMVSVQVGSDTDYNILRRAGRSVNIAVVWFEREYTLPIFTPRTSATAREDGNSGSGKREGSTLKPRAKKRQNLGDLLSY